MMLERQADIQVVAEVEDGIAVVKAAAAHIPDLVLMDIGMPQLDGIGATRRILAQQPDARVLALSLHPVAQFVQTKIDAGARGYVLKEDPFPELLRAIREVAAGGTYFSPALLPPQSPTPESGSGAC
jgi:DNA-binding NarL/FixJ family response regulator